MRVIFTKINIRYIPEYCLITKIVQDETGVKRVVKTPFDNRALRHLHGLETASRELPGIFSSMKICPCEPGDGEVSFDFIEGETYLSRLKEAASKPIALYYAAWRDFMSLLEPVDTVAFRESEPSSRLFGDMAAFIGVPSYARCAVDLTPSNVLVAGDDKPTLIDYEWWVDEPVPVELIQYHALYTTWEFHPEIRHAQVTLETLLGECGFDEASVERCDRALQHFYSHIGGTTREQKPYYLSLPRYTQQSIPVETFGVENRMLKQQNAQLFHQIEEERKVREDMLAGWREASRSVEVLREDMLSGWREASRSVEVLREQLARNEAEYAKERTETQRQMEEERKVREDMLSGWREASRSVEILREQLARNEAEYAKEHAEAQRQNMDLRQKLKKRNEAYAELNRHHEISVSEWTATAERYRQSEAQRQNAEEQLRLLMTSRSWKLTRPLRGLKTVTKRAIGKSAIAVYHLVKRMVKKEEAQVKVKTLPQNWPPVGAELAKDVTTPLCDKPNRLAIYFFFDRDGKIDRYVPYFLEALSKSVARIVFVSNGPLQPESEATVRALVSDVIVRENKGYDSWAMKTGLEYVGRENLQQYDEVLLLNYTFFGPVSPLEDVIDSMASRAVDFWGMVSHPGLPFDPMGCCPYGDVLPAHIQSFWIAIRKRMFDSDAFWNFWDKLPLVNNYNEAVGYFEAVFTRYFSELGYKWDTWISSETYRDMSDNVLVDMPVEMVRDAACPIVKRRAFFQDYDYLTSFTGQHTAAFLIDYIREELDYPEALIWENLIRTVHMSTLTEDMHLAQILDKYDYQGKPVVQMVQKRPTALFMHIFDTSMAEEMAGYADNLPDNADIWVSTTDEEKKKIIERVFAAVNRKVNVRICPNRGRDVSALLVSFTDVVMNYDIICVTHDKKTAHLKPQTVGEGFAYMGYENNLASREFVANVLQAFDENPFLGLLYTPEPNHADFSTLIGHEWGNNYAATRALADELGLHVPMDDQHKACASYGSNFWIRTAALRPIYNKHWTYDDFPAEPVRQTDGTIMHAIERIYPYCAQHAGYYSAMLMTTEYSAVELGNLQFYAETYARLCAEQGIVNRYISVRDQLDMRLGPSIQAPVSTGETPPGRLEALKGKIRDKLTLWANS